MDFEFIDHRRGAASKYFWLPPFDWTVAYDNERWWDEPRYYYVGEPWFVQVLEDGDEVARVELDDPAASTLSTRMFRSSGRSVWRSN